MRNHCISAAGVALVLAGALALAGCASGPANPNGSNQGGGGAEAMQPRDSAEPAASSQEGAAASVQPAGSGAADSAAAGPVTFTDDSGAEVTVENPQRVVACMGSFASIWELAGGTLVGASDDAFTLSDYDLVSQDVQKVGDFSSLNLEAILALEPDFVIMTSGTGGRGGDSSQTELKEALAASGVSTAYFQVTTFDDYLRMLRICCDITGRDDLYQANGQDVADRIAAIVGKVPAVGADGEPTALVLTTYSGGTRVQASSTMTGAMLFDLGVHNLVDDNPSMLKDFSLESIIALNPDYIFVIPMGDDEEAARKALEDQTADNPAWATLSAVQNGNYVVLDPHLFQYKPNNHWDESYQVLYDVLYAN